MPAATLLFCCLSPNTTISSKWPLRVFWKAGLSTSQPQVLFSWFELLEIFQTSRNPARNSAIMELVCVRAFIFVQFDSELKALKFNFDSVVIECSPTFALRHIFPPLFHWILVSPPIRWVSTTHVLLAKNELPHPRELSRPLSVLNILLRHLLSIRELR